jgi:hypothetical protein
MALTVEERREINRQNASHSTGPKSPEGRRRASLNAMTHGLRAETLALPGEDPEELRQMTDDWLDYHQPQSPGQRAAIDRCVYSILQGRRCARFQAAVVAEQVRKAELEWAWEHEDELARLKKLLKTEPDEAVRLLRRSALGCRWMLAEWADLAEGLDEDGMWVNSRRDRAIRLLGHSTENKHIKDHEDAYLLRFYNLYAHEEPPAVSVAYLADPKVIPDTLTRTIDGTWRPDPESSRQTLREMIAEQVEELASLEERLRVEIEGPSLAGAVERAMALRGPDGVLLARYERMHDAMYNRAFKTLTQGEKEAAKGDAPGGSASQSNDPFGGVEVLDFAVGRAGAPNEANEGGPVGASAGAVGTPLPGMRVALVDALGPDEGVTGPTSPVGGFETPPARGS